MDRTGRIRQPRKFRQSRGAVSTCARQIRCLDFSDDKWKNIRRFLEVGFGPFPLLHTLAIDASEDLDPSEYRYDSDVEDDSDVLPPQPLLNGSVNLKVLRFHSRSWLPPSLARFVFPNLVSFDFSATSPRNFSTTPQLLDFLEASPMLRTVHMTIFAGTLSRAPEGRIVILPNAESFKVTVGNETNAYSPAVAHISCPSVRLTSLTFEKVPDLDEIAIAPESAFPVLWDEMVHQYTRSPVEEVAVEIKISHVTTSKLTFRSGDGSTIELCFKADDVDDREQVLTDATKTIQDHPQLANVRRLRVCHNFDHNRLSTLSNIASEIEKLFKSVGPLDELTIHGCNIWLYLHPFLTSQKDTVKTPVMFPPTKELTFSHLPPISSRLKERTAIVELAKSQHALGTPFERMVFRGKGIFGGIEKELEPWVGSAEHRYEEPCSYDSDE